MAKPQTKYDKDPRPAIKCIPITVGLVLGRKDDERRRKATRERRSKPKLTGLTEVALKAIQSTIQARLPSQLRKEDHVAVASSSSHSSNGTRDGQGVAARDDGRASTRTGDKRKRLTDGHGADDGSDGRASKRSREGERVSADPPRPQMAEKRKRPAEDCGADAGSDGRSSKKMRDGDRAPTHDGVRPLIATRFVPSEGVPTARTSAARPSAARPSAARPSTLSRAATTKDVPARRASTTRLPTHSRAAPSASTPATRSCKPAHPAPSKAGRSLDVRDDASSSKTARKNAPSIADATKLRSEEKRCPPKNNVHSLKKGDDPLECLFEPGLAFSSTNRFLRLFVRKAQTDKDFKCELIERCWYIIDEPLGNKTMKHLRAAKAFEDLSDLPWPFLRRVRAKVLYIALDKGTPLEDFEEACRKDLAKLQAADVDR